jgi:hypothetical protein
LFSNNYIYLLKKIKKGLQNTKKKMDKMQKEFEDLTELCEMAKKAESERQKREEKERIDEELTCAICYQKYDDAEHWKSVLTACGHQFGESCLFRVSESQNPA